MLRRKDLYENYYRYQDADIQRKNDLQVEDVQEMKELQIHVEVRQNKAKSR